MDLILTLLQHNRAWNTVLLASCSFQLLRDSKTYARNTTLLLYKPARHPQSQDFPKIAQIDPFLDIITSVLDVYEKFFTLLKIFLPPKIFHFYQFFYF